MQKTLVLHTHPRWQGLQVSIVCMQLAPAVNTSVPHPRCPMHLPYPMASPGRARGTNKRDGEAPGPQPGDAEIRVFDVGQVELELEGEC